MKRGSAIRLNSNSHVTTNSDNTKGKLEKIRVYTDILVLINNNVRRQNHNFCITQKKYFFFCKVMVLTKVMLAIKTDIFSKPFFRVIAACGHVTVRF